MTHAAMNLDLSSHDILSTINEQSDTNEEHTETIADAQSISDATQLSAFLFSAGLGEYEESCRQHAVCTVDELNMLNEIELEELIPKLEHRILWRQANAKKTKSKEIDKVANTKTETEVTELLPDRKSDFDGDQDGDRNAATINQTTSHSAGRKRKFPFEPAVDVATD